jgi:allantoicase
MILPRTKLGPHRRHFFQLQNVDHIKYTHVMLTIYPDGGIKRIRAIGTRAIGLSSGSKTSIPGETETPTTDTSQGESGVAVTWFTQCAYIAIQWTRGVRCLIR